MGRKLHDTFDYSKNSESRKIQTPGNYPEESIQHSEHGESLKSRIIHLYGEETARHIRLFEKLWINKNSDAGKLPRRKHTTFRTRRKFEIKNNSPIWGGNCTTHSTIRKTLNQEKFRRRGITQKKAYNIQNTAKVWNQKGFSLCSDINSQQSSSEAKHLNDDIPNVYLYSWFQASDSK